MGKTATNQSAVQVSQWLWTGPKGSGRYRNIETGLMRDFRFGPPHRGKWEFAAPIYRQIIYHPAYMEFRP